MFPPLQELKKKRGIKDEVQLTSKQKEMMQLQLEKEAAVRKRLLEVSKREAVRHDMSSHLFFVFFGGPVFFR